MKRILEIIGDIRRRYPCDDFFSNFEEDYRISSEKGGMRDYYCLYNKALITLDNESWEILKEKALNQYMNHREGQKKQGFFNHLNETFAYQYLVHEGFDDVRFIREGPQISPDIQFVAHGIPWCCEVKTLGISDAQIKRRSSFEVIDIADYINLDNGFLNKFSDAVIAARKQMQSWGTNGLVYIIVNFDDPSLDLYQDYHREQLIKFVQDHGFENLFIKIGLLGNESILHNPSFHMPGRPRQR